MERRWGPEVTLPAGRACTFTADEVIELREKKIQHSPAPQRGKYELVRVPVETWQVLIW